MNREAINKLLDQIEANNHAFASGSINKEQFMQATRSFHERLSVYGLGLTILMATPPF